MNNIQFLFLVAWMAVFPFGLAAETPLAINLVMHDYPPLTGEKLPYGGILTRIVKESFAKTNVAVKVTWVPNNRAISGVMDGIYDGSYGWAHAPERDEKLFFSSNVLYTFRMVFFQRRGEEFPWKKLEDLGTARIGATMGNHYSDEFSSLQAAGKLKVDEASADAFNMKKLAAGRIDLFPIEQEAGLMLADVTLSKAERERIIPQADALWEVPTFVVIRKTHPLAKELLARFDRGHRLLVSSGRLKTLIEETRQAIRDAQKTQPQ